MKLNEILTTDKGIFSCFKEYNATLYAQWFTSDVVYYDNYVLYQYGYRTASEWFAQNKDDIAAPLNMVFASCIEGWKRVYAALTAEYDVSSPYSYTETEKGSSSTQSNGNTETIESGKPYNATDFVSTDKNTTDSDNTSTATHTTEKERKGANGELISYRIQQELELRHKRFLDRFIYDVINYISLSVYE